MTARRSVSIHRQGFTLEWRPARSGWLMTMTDACGQDLGAWLLAPSVAGANGAALPMIASAMAEIAVDAGRPSRALAGSELRETAGHSDMPGTH
ncbi:hypothetical protein SAMN02745194_03166 [Roseomonas rosea]|uniref:Uncharacterized protein n=1 Tax=Muricoccus roseus TaxID=198092 RepID=A0A1M6LGD5_9PROT|nr:hypothetical protein [Roseomonas rosea]SHJ70257.1 hypothetical protein SAMN02745194_03166 [Roseomonas rosea]